MGKFGMWELYGLFNERGNCTFIIVNRFLFFISALLNPIN